MKKNKKMSKNSIETPRKEKTVTNKVSTKKVIVDAMILVLAIIILIGLIFLIRFIVITNKYAYYTEKMNWYNYNKLYDNESAKATDKVYSDEITKMVLGVLYNKTNKSFAKERLYESDVTDVSINESWIDFAKNIPVQTANDVKLNEKSSKLQVAKMLVEGIECIYGKDIEITDKLNEKYRYNYTDETLNLIDKAISIGILKNSFSDIQKNGMLKGELNQMLIIVLEKYATPYYKSMYSTVNLVKEKDELPYNADKYPYVVDNIPKEIYEIEMPEMMSSISETPKQVYDIYHDEYYNTEENLREYFDTILNIDYRKINVDDFIDKLNMNVVYDIYGNYSGKAIYEETVKKYIDYVKDNNIVLSGEITPMLPIIYSNGMLHYIRCKLDLKIVNSKTNKNILLWDSDTTYNSNDISVYVDVAVSPTIYSKAFRIFNGVSVMKYICKDDKNAIAVANN